MFEALALAGLVVTLVTAVCAVALLVGSWRVVKNTLRYLRLLLFIGLLTCWIFSLALSGCNGVLNLMSVSPHVPFPQPGLLTGISLGSLVGYGVLLAQRQPKAARASLSVVGGTWCAATGDTCARPGGRIGIWHSGAGN